MPIGINATPITKKVGRTVPAVNMGCHAGSRCCLNALSEKSNYQNYSQRFRSKTQSINNQFLSTYCTLMGQYRKLPFGFFVFCSPAPFSSGDESAIGFLNIYLYQGELSCTIADNQVASLTYFVSVVVKTITEVRLPCKCLNCNFNITLI